MRWLGGEKTFFSSFKGGSRPPFEAIYVYLLAVFLGYTISDLAILSYRPTMLPNEAPPAKINRSIRSRQVSLLDYESISDRNFFNSDGKIPPPLSAEGKEEDQVDRPAVLSQLPLKLEGTIVHLNEKKSVSSINIRNKNETQVFGIDDEIDGIARVTKIERRKVTFRNLANNRLEYIEIPKDVKINFGVKAPKSTESNVIEKRGEFDFSIKREDLNKYTSNLSEILNQARMVPNIIPGSGGRVDGFRFVSINPGSIFEKLGFKTMDVIRSVNGEPVNSPTRAMEFYNALKSSSNIQLGVERNGREEDFTYSVTE
ncbi:MAG: general secretion pathway protein GspC [Bdellovibrionales bacterium]|nr:general secretion pathway protein GspC [Bdellovibrionales bacterium]